MACSFHGEQTGKEVLVDVVSSFLLLKVWSSCLFLTLRSNPWRWLLWFTPCMSAINFHVLVWAGAHCRTTLVLIKLLTMLTKMFARTFNAFGESGLTTLVKKHNLLWDSFYRILSASATVWVARFLALKLVHMSPEQPWPLFLVLWV